MEALIENGRMQASRRPPLAHHRVPFVRHFHRMRHAGCAGYMQCNTDHIKFSFLATIGFLPPSLVRAQCIGDAGRAVFGADNVSKTELVESSTTFSAVVVFLLKPRTGRSSGESSARAVQRQGFVIQN